MNLTTASKEAATAPAALRVIGVGAAGGRLARLACEGCAGVPLRVAAVRGAGAPAEEGGELLRLGTAAEVGTGCGGDPEAGKRAAWEAEGEVRAAVKGARMVLLCAGLGGGTGSGAAPVLARIAREEGAFVAAVVTLPFSFEGARRAAQARTAADELAGICHLMILFDNNFMAALSAPRAPLDEAFRASGALAGEAAAALLRMAMRPGLMSLGLDDLSTAFAGLRPVCRFGHGRATGKDRLAKALRAACDSPLLASGRYFDEAAAVVVQVCGGPDLTLAETESALGALTARLPETCMLHFGVSLDPAWKGAASVAVLCPVELEDAETGEATPDLAGTLRPVEAAPEERISPNPVEEPAAVRAVFVSAPPPETRSAAPVSAADPVAETSAAVGHGPDAPGEVPVSTAPPMPPAAKPAAPAAAASTPAVPNPAAPRLKIGLKGAATQSELSLDSVPRGRFEGDGPNVFDGEDLDLPPFLRKKK